MWLHCVVCFLIYRKSLSISSTVVDYLFVNPCDWHLISPYIINSESHIEVTRMIKRKWSHTEKALDCWFKKFFSSVCWEMYGDQYGEHEYWYYGVKGWHKVMYKPCSFHLLTCQGHSSWGDRLHRSASDYKKQTKKNE